MVRVLPFVLIFATGGVVGMLFARTMLGPEPTVDTFETGSSVSADEDGTAEPAVAEEELDSGPVRAIATGLDAAGGDSVIERAIASVGTVDVGARDGEISGQVTTVEGTPLPGVEITATASGYRDDREDAESLNEKVVRYIRDEQWRQTLRSEAVTDGDGRYRLSGIGSIEYRVSAELDAHRFESPGRASSRAEAGDTVDFTATPVAQIRVSIVRADGSVPAKASVRVEANRSSRGHNWTSEDRTVDVDPGTFTVRAHVEQSENSEPVEVTVELGTPVDVELVLRARGSIRGRLVFPPEELDTNASVAMLPATLIPEPSPEDFAGADHRNWVSSSRGEFTFADLDPGRYWLGYARGHRWGQSLESMLPVDVGTEPVEVRIEIPGIDLAGACRVSVFHPDGRPIPDANVQMGFQSENRSSWGGGDVTRLRGGMIVVRPDEGMQTQLDQFPDGRLFVIVSDESYGQERIEVSPGGGHYEVRFEAPSTLELVVAGYVGSDLVGKLQVSVSSDGEDDPFRGRHGGSRPDTEGIVKLGPMRPGAYTVHLTYEENRDGHWSTGELSAQPISIVAGENRVTIGIPTLHDVAIELPADVVGSMGLHHAARTGGPRQFFQRQATIADGFVQFSAVPPGRYVVRFHGGSVQAQPMTIDVPTSGPIYYDIVPPTAVIVVSVSEEGGLLTDAGFADGDLIRAVEGVVYEAEEQLPMMTDLLQAGGPVRLLVEREGEEFEMTFDPRGLREVANPGGACAPRNAERSGRPPPRRKSFPRFRFPSPGAALECPHGGSSETVSRRARAAGRVPGPPAEGRRRTPCTGPCSTRRSTERW